MTDSPASRYGYRTIGGHWGSVLLGCVLLFPAIHAVAQSPQSSQSQVGNPLSNFDWQKADLAAFRTLTDVAPDVWETVEKSVPLELSVRHSKLPESIGVTRALRHPVLVNRGANGFSRESALPLNFGLLRVNSTIIFGQGKTTLTVVSLMGLLNVLSYAEFTAPRRTLFGQGEAATIKTKFRLTKIVLPESWPVALAPRATWTYEAYFERERSNSDKPGEIDRKTEGGVTTCKNGERVPASAAHGAIAGSMIAIDCRTGDSSDGSTTRYLYFEDYAFFFLVVDRNSELERIARLNDWN